MALPLILLPGLDGTGDLFRPFIQSLPSSWDPRVIAYPTDEPLGYRELLPFVRRSFPAEPFVLLAESFSGPLAIMAAAANPPGLRAMVLCATFASSPLSWLPSGVAHLACSSFLRWIPHRALLPLVLNRSAAPELTQLFLRALVQVHSDVLAHRLRAVHRIDVTAELASCRVPILYLRADHDRLVPAAAMRKMQRANPSIRIVQLASPHLLLQTHPAPAITAIEQFIQSTPSNP